MSRSLDRRRFVEKLSAVLLASTSGVLAQCAPHVYRLGILFLGGSIGGGATLEAIRGRLRPEFIGSFACSLLAASLVARAQKSAVALIGFISKRGHPVTGRRTFIAALLGVLAAPALCAQSPAQLGFLRIVVPPKDYIDSFEQGLRDRGYVPGRDVVIDYRFADGREEQLERLARELVERKVDILIVAGEQALRSARNASRTIPIVMAIANDPVAGGFVNSLARPGGNVTGTTLLSSTLAGKRLQLLKEVLPHVSRIAILINKDNPGHAVAWKETLAMAATMRIKVQPYEVQGAASFDGAFARMMNDRVDGLVLLEDILFGTERVRLAALAAQARLPAVYGQRNSVDDGGLMSYGPSIADVYRNAGNFVDRILKGAKPADLPVEQPTKYEFVVNLKTAKTLGLTIPQSLLLRANDVIR